MSRAGSVGGERVVIACSRRRARDFLGDVLRHDDDVVDA